MVFKASENLGYAVTHNITVSPKLVLGRQAESMGEPQSAKGLHGPVPRGEEVSTACQAPSEETRAAKPPARLQQAVPCACVARALTSLLPKLQDEPQLLFFGNLSRLATLLFRFS